MLKKMIVRRLLLLLVLTSFDAIAKIPPFEGWTSPISVDI